MNDCNSVQKCNRCGQHKELNNYIFNTKCNSYGKTCIQCINRVKQLHKIKLKR
jgi:hypothetical protein